MDYSSDQYTPSFDKYPDFSDMNIGGYGTQNSQLDGRRPEHAEMPVVAATAPVRPHINIYAIIVFMLVLWIIHCTRELAALRLDISAMSKALLLAKS